MNSEKAKPVSGSVYLMAPSRRSRSRDGLAETEVVKVRFDIQIEYGNSLVCSPRPANAANASENFISTVTISGGYALRQRSIHQQV